MKKFLCSRELKWHINRSQHREYERCTANKSAWVWLSIKFSKLLLLYGLLFFESFSLIFFRVEYNNFIIIMHQVFAQKNASVGDGGESAGVKHLYYQKWKNWSICLINVNTRAEYHEYFFTPSAFFAISSARNWIDYWRFLSRSRS